MLAFLSTLYRQPPKVDIPRFVVIGLNAGLDLNQRERWDWRKKQSWVEGLSVAPSPTSSDAASATFFC
jgi:hypothetical protein